VEHQPAVVRSTAHHFGIGMNPLALGSGDDFQADAEVGGVLDDMLAVAAVGPLIARVGWSAATWSSRWVPAVESCTLAAVTSTASRRPIVSTTMLRLRPPI
jgi:hypothetical protein